MDSAPLPDHDLEFLAFTKMRAAFACLIAIVSFWIPQEIALEWYPLNNPSSGLQYLEITTGANFNGTVEIYHDLGRGYNWIDRIELPIGPSEMAFTYTFPLKDAPLRNIRLDPIRSGAGELTITNMRLINRREEEILRFTKDSFKQLKQVEIKEISPTSWKLVTAEGADDPQTFLPLAKPIVAEGMNERNFKRCLLSWSYLAGMLLLIMSALASIFIRRYAWRTLWSPLLMMVILALMFSAVGNRGLIRESIQSALFALTVKP